MRRAIVLTTKHKETGREEIRLYTMNHRQAVAFRDAICRTRGDRRKVELSVERAIVHLLAGRPITEDTPPEIAKLSYLFGKLETRVVENLPRAGCPEGWIESIILSMQKNDGKNRVIRFDMTTDQQRAFNNAIVAVDALQNCGRDAAWLNVIHIVQRLLGGARPADGCEDFIRELADVFEEKNIGEMLLRPEADELDLARWAYTRAPL